MDVNLLTDDCFSSKYCSSQHFALKTITITSLKGHMIPKYYAVTVYWLVLCVNLTQARVARERSLSYKNSYRRSSCKILSQWSVIDWEGSVHCGWYHPWPGGLGNLGKSRLSKLEETSQEAAPAPPHQLLPPGSCPFEIPLLTSFSDEQQCGGISQATLSSSTCFIVVVFITAIECSQISLKLYNISAILYWLWLRYQRYMHIQRQSL